MDRIGAILSSLWYSTFSLKQMVSGEFLIKSEVKVENRKVDMIKGKPKLSTRMF